MNKEQKIEDMMNKIKKTHANTNIIGGINPHKAQVFMSELFSGNQAFMIAGAIIRFIDGMMRTYKNPDTSEKEKAIINVQLKEAFDIVAKVMVSLDKRGHDKIIELLEKSGFSVQSEEESDLS